MGEQRDIARRALIVTSAAVAAGVAAAPAEAVDPTRQTDFTIWDPVTGRSDVALTPRRVTMHIAVSNSTDIYGPGTIGGTYAHFYNRREGQPRQHQTMNKRAVADANGNDTTISVEHQGVDGDFMTDSQKTYLARIFAWAVVWCGVPNRIATVDNTRGLAWHRLGIDGNFGAYDPNDRTTWCRKQTGAVWSSSFGKLCPTDRFIRQIPEVYNRAQVWIDFYRTH
jgi:hypothetical protein